MSASTQNSVKIESIDFPHHEVVIDCGHLPARHDGTHLIFGDHSGHPSQTQLSTLELGVFLLAELKKLGKSPTLSICFSDTTKYIGDPRLRNELQRVIDNRDIVDHLPKEYKEILSDSEVKNCISFTLQSRNSNRFSALLKKIKKEIRSKSTEVIYKEYSIIPVTDLADGMFGFVSPFLLDRTNEVAALGGEYWLSDLYQISPYQIASAPLARIKKLGLIKLMNKIEGILCPATYGGLLLNAQKRDSDNIAIYSRADDEYIGEKINRGAIAAHHLLKDFQALTVQVILPEFGSEHEISILSQDRVLSKKPLFSEFYSQCLDLGIFSKYTIFT